MKKYIYALLASIMVGTSCTSLNDEILVDNSPIKGDNVLEATLEEKGNSRTTMSELTDGVYKTLWSADDLIAVFIDGSGNPAQYKLIAGEETSTASFKGYGKGDSYAALYPATMAKGLEGEQLSLQLPAEQTYVKGSFGPNSFPMVAVSDTELLTFKNTCAVLKISMTGTHSIESIVFKANNEKVYVSGDAMIDLGDYPYPKLVMQRGASNEVTLVCNGVALNRQTATDFHLVVPAQTYKGGFTLTINTSTGYMVKSTTEDVVLERSQIRSLKSFACRLDEGIEPSVNLQGKGTGGSPFLIQCLEDLLLMQSAVNSESGTILPADGGEAVVANTAHYKLTKDISLAEVCGESKGSWEPIGNYSVNENFVFEGIFDGDGHFITDLYINNIGADFQGFFGRTSITSTIKNLRINGAVIARLRCALICGTGGIIENCESHGSVKVDASWGGGVVGDGYCIFNSINYASVYGDGSYIGGIAGRLGGIAGSSVIKECTNVGEVYNGQFYTGGIVGYNSGQIYNCYNLGKIESKWRHVGGVSGGCVGSLYNCYNTGHVIGNEYIGGISGECNGKILNCMNLGTIESTEVAQYMGSICGLNSSNISHCYWLYDEEKNLGMKTGIAETESSGKIEKCFGLTEAQMKGQENYYTALYTSSDNTVYYIVLDALNACANDYKTNDMKLFGWKQDSTDDYPIFNGREAEKPKDDSKPLFELSQTSFKVSNKGGDISINVAANMSYYISSIPDWITEVSSESRLVSEKIHVFRIQENTDKGERQGVIVFCNEKEQCIPVTIVQKGKVDEDMSWTKKDFWHKSLAMRFTADWCGYCPIMAESFAEAQKKKPGKIEVVHMHCSGNLVFEAGRPLWEHYNISGYPTGIVDSRYEVRNYQPDINSGYIVKVVEETEKKYGTQSGISFESYVSDGQISVDLKLYLKKADKYKVTVLLLEGNIVGYQNGKGNDYVHNDVIRMTLTDIKGNEFSTDEDNTIREFSYKGTIPSICNKDNLRVLVYVERAYGSQQVISSGDYGDYYVDNALSEKVGVEAVLKLVE